MGLWKSIQGSSTWGRQNLWSIKPFMAAVGWPCFSVPWRWFTFFEKLEVLLGRTDLNLISFKYTYCSVQLNSYGIIVWFFNASCMKCCEDTNFSAWCQFLCASSLFFLQNYVFRLHWAMAYVWICFLQYQWCSASVLVGNSHKNSPASPMWRSCVQQEYMYFSYLLRGVGEQRLLLTSLCLEQYYQHTNCCWRELALSQEPGRSLCRSSVPAVKPWQHFPFFWNFLSFSSILCLNCEQSLFLVGICTVPISMGSAFLWDCWVPL